MAELGGALIHGVTGIANVIGTLTGSQQPPRALTDRERRVLGEVYGPGLNLDDVRVIRGGPNTISLPGEPRIPRGIGNTIYWPTEGPYAQYMDEGGIKENARYGLETFVHEAAHIAQYQNEGRSGSFNSLMAQAGAILRTGDRSNAYNWREQARNGVAWADLNAEEQASLVESFYAARGGRILYQGVDLTDYANNAMAEVRAGRGWR